MTKTAIYLELNELQTKGIVEAIKEAASPNAEWTDHADVKAVHPPIWSIGQV